MTALALAFTAGVLSILSPCVLPLVPIVLGAEGMDGYRGAVALAAGLASSSRATVRSRPRPTVTEAITAATTSSGARATRLARPRVRSTISAAPGPTPVQAMSAKRLTAF